MVPSGINVPPGKFGKNNNSTTLNKGTPWKTQKSEILFLINLYIQPIYSLTTHYLCRIPCLSKSKQCFNENTSTQIALFLSLLYSIKKIRTSENPNFNKCTVRNKSVPVGKKSGKLIKVPVLLFRTLE